MFCRGMSLMPKAIVTDWLLALATLAATFVAAAAFVMFLAPHPVLLAAMVLAVSLSGVYLIGRRRRVRGQRPYSSDSPLLLILLGWFFIMIPVGILGTGIYTSDHIAKTVLFRIDHAQLLSSCREVMHNVDRYRRRPNSNSPQLLDPTDPNLPKAIRDLDPMWIHVTPKSVTLALTGGFDHMSVIALTEDITDSDDIVKSLRGHGDLQLIPGLWFCESERSPRINYPKQ